MIIDTHSRSSLISSVLKFLNVTEIELRCYLNDINSRCKTDFLFDGYKFDAFIDIYIDEHCDLTQLKEVQFYHLGRRLNSALNNNEGKNLKNLLLNDSNMNEFFSSHNILFYESDRFISMTFNGNEIKLDNMDEKNTCYLRNRLGYNKEQDYCFNGFMMKDLLYKNDYARNLSTAPEFIGQLADILEYEELIDSYMDQSKYYCFEYLVPLSEIIIDGTEENLSDNEKARYIIKAALKRINQYYDSSVEYIFDSENLIFRLRDDTNLDSRYFVNKEEITNEMLRYEVY